MATADVALGLTLAARGTHHLADFLPKEELEKFLKKAEVTTPTPWAHLSPCRSL